MAVGSNAGSATRPRAPRRWLRRIFWVGIAFFVLSWLVGRNAGPTIEPGSFLVIPLAGSYVEAAEAPLIERLLGDAGTPMLSLLGQLAMAERDDRLAGVVLRVGNLGIGWGKAQELRLAIARLRAAGRQTIAVLEFESIGAMKEYYVASAAAEVYVAPGSLVPVAGLAAEYLFLGGSYEKLGVDWEVSRVGRYKSAVESYTSREMSDDARAMTDAMIDSIELQIVAGIGESRGLEASQVRATIDAAPMRASELTRHKLIEGERSVAALLGGLDHVVHAREYAAVDASEVGFDPVARYALIYGAGPVITGKAPARGGPSFASDVAVKALDDAAKDAEIDAVILRMDSPGGSALASEIIWQAVERVKAAGKPVVATYSDYAASGGYYASVGADTIVSHGAALTGSIGVFMLRPEIGALLEKLEVGVETITRGKHADIQLASRPLSEGSQARLQASVTDAYDLFVSRVSAGRELPTAAVDAVAQGYVWTGTRALEQGLIDEIGGLREAVYAAKLLHGIERDADVALVPYPAPKPLAEQIAELMQLRVDPIGLFADRWTRSLESPIVDFLRWQISAPKGVPLAISPIAVDFR